MLGAEPRDKAAAERLVRTLLEWLGRPLVSVADNKLRSYAAASGDLGLNVEHAQHEGLKMGEANNPQPLRRERAAQTRSARLGLHGSGKDSARPHGS